MLVSVIVPVLDEAEQIAACLAAVLDQAGEWELLVVDGGSRDDTRALAAAAGARVLETARGRGAQLDHGARTARGEALLFLHADVRLPAGMHALVCATLQDPRWIAGALPVQHDASGAPLLQRAALRITAWTSRWRRLPYGDQCLFTRHSTYAACGGIPHQPLMEDVEFSQRLRARGRIRMGPLRALASPRRFATRPVRTFLAWLAFPTLYRLGVSPERLARWYR
ncbi:MAG TPA: TIGR04283 family arsenosugar biosynthesis glycosyltransferase [Planctomycetota bacterium]